MGIFGNYLKHLELENPRVHWIGKKWSENETTSTKWPLHIQESFFFHFNQKFTFWHLQQCKNWSANHLSCVIFNPIFKYDNYFWSSLFLNSFCFFWLFLKFFTLFQWKILPHSFTVSHSLSLFLNLSLALSLVLPLDIRYHGWRFRWSDLWRAPL